MSGKYRPTGNPYARGKQNTQIIGEYNFICDRSGFKTKISDGVVTWDGFLVRKEWEEPRTPQDFVRSIRDQKPLDPAMVRPDIEDREFTNLTNDEASLIASLIAMKR